MLVTSKIFWSLDFLIKKDTKELNPRPLTNAPETLNSTIDPKTLKSTNPSKTLKSPNSPKT